ncbi:hypothetical protein QAD02_005077 [Eretmocerus hayati]|uniref:Uncharacterized protein n=1 Tax=Eretmocerus hayati TaxID=131215 RepID=A0ACC2NW89_9HYME|nr:hypothetical protein QAD02_005077 [Eretmocerus hayati]
MVAVLQTRSILVRGPLILRIRGMRSQARTINPSDPLTCERPRQVQKLVTADIGKLCPVGKGNEIGQAYPVPRIAPVRVCKRRDLERACPPKFCKCPQKLPPKTFNQNLWCLTKFGVKGACAAGLVYWSVAEGIWGENDKTEDFYMRMKEAMAKDPELSEVRLPHLDNMKFKILDSYNRAVLAVIGILVGVPMKINKAINDKIHPCEPPPPPKKGWFR